MKNSILKLIVLGSFALILSGCNANQNVSTPNNTGIFDNNNWTPVNHKATNLNKVVN